MASELVSNAYGKTGIRLLRLLRGSRHEVLETTLEVRLEGDFAEAYEGDNSRVLPTDTMKNTVYAVARELPFGSSEELCRLLGRHFLATQPQVLKATVSAVERPWQRYAEEKATFVGGGEERATVGYAIERRGGDTREKISAGIANLLILKTSKSGFENFPRDRYTTLKETADRLLATRLEATWTYHRSSPEDIDFVAARVRIFEALMQSFADHDSRSVQETLKAMGEAALEAAPEVDEIHLVMPNKHYLLVNLEPFGLDNPNQVFLPTDEPAGRIEGTLRRRG
jgi:urate oxidase